MISYETIIKAKAGNIEAINQILLFYIPVIKRYSLDEDFRQKVLIEILKGIKNFKNF